MNKFKSIYTSPCIHQTQFIQSEQLRHARSSLESVFISRATWEIIAIDCHVIVTSGHNGRPEGARLHCRQEQARGGSCGFPGTGRACGARSDARSLPTPNASEPWGTSHHGVTCQSHVMVLLFIYGFLECHLQGEHEGF